MESLAKELTISNILGALGWAFAIVVLMVKHFKAVNDTLPSVIKAWKYVQSKMFREAIFRKDILEKLDSMRILQHKQGDVLEKNSEAIEHIKKEPSYNGGSSLKDTVSEIREGVEYNRQFGI